MTPDNRLDWLLDQATDHPLTTSQVAVLAMLLALGGSGMAKVTKLELGALVGLKERQISTVLKELETHVAGFIKAQRNGRAGNSYAIRPDAIGSPVPATWRRSGDNQQPNSGIPLPVTNDNRHSAAGLTCGETAPCVSQHAGVRADWITSNLRDSELYPDRARQTSTSARESVDRPNGQVLADHIVDSVASPWLDPAKQRSGLLYRTCGRIVAWMNAGADLELDIIPTIKRMCATQREPIGSWNFFENEITKATAQRLAAEQTIDPIQPATGATGAQDGYGNITPFPRNAAERNAAIARDHLASWGPLLAEAEGDGAYADGRHVEQAVAN